MDGFQMPPIPQLPTDGPTVGAFLLGTVFSLILGGLVSVQALDYVTCAFFIAPKAYLALITLLVTAGLLSSSFSFHTVWLWFVKGYGDPSVFAVVPWSYIWSIFLLGFVACLSQYLFAWHIFRTGGRFSEYLAIPIVALASSGLALAIAASVRLDAGGASWGSFNSHHRLLVAWVWATAGYVDQKQLRKQDDETTFARSARLVRLLDRSNGFTLVVVFIDAILVSTMPFYGWHNLLFLPMTQLYTGACVGLVENAYHVEIQALEATLSTSPSTGLHSSPLRSKRAVTPLNDPQHAIKSNRAGQFADADLVEKEESSTRNGSATEVGSDYEKVSMPSTSTAALRTAVAEPFTLPNHPYAIARPLKSQSPTGRHPYAAPAHEQD
ncbi:hypothetical protein JCM8202_004273 [Rhodotorula sphaerocarpa]